MSEIEFSISASPEATAYLAGIAQEMLMLFAISPDEAVGRIERYWAPLDLVADEYSIGELLHRDEEYWAKTIYYGRNSFWWIKEEGARARALAVTIRTLQQARCRRRVSDRGSR